MTLDPTRYAVRPDLADIRLADRVFAPHYAAPVQRTVSCETPLRHERSTASPVVATLRAGECFELLDVVSGDAWGIATATALVGYCDASALGQP